jgi:uncharacterized OsmC-like protein
MRRSKTRTLARLDKEVLMSTVAEAIAKLTKVFTEQPEKARTRNAPATAVFRDGLKFQVTGPAGEKVLTDMPPPMGGAGSGPNPGWLLRAALASCNATVIAMRAAKLGVRLKSLEVGVESESDNRGLLGLDEAVSAGLSNLRTKVKISAEGATPAQLREIVAWAEAHSPVGCTIGQSLNATTDVEIV